MRILVTDVETTGIDPETDKVVEIAGIPLTWTLGAKRFEVGAPIQHLVNPARPIPATASAIHHITDSHVRGAPPIDDVLQEYCGYDFYVAHNAKFDSAFLEGIGGSWICTMKCCYEEHHDAPSYSNQALSYWLGTPRPPEGSGHAHRALYDCWTTLGLLDDLRSRGWTGQRMVQVSSRPKLLRAMPFGKYKGESFKDLPRDYVDWMRRQNDWDADVSYTLKEVFG